MSEPTTTKEFFHSLDLSPNDQAVAIAAAEQIVELMQSMLPVLKMADHWINAGGAALAIATKAWEETRVDRETRGL